MTIFYMNKPQATRKINRTIWQNYINITCPWNSYDEFRRMSGRGDGVMEEQKRNTELNITFHDPNTLDELAKFLVKLLAENVAEYI